MGRICLLTWLSLSGGLGAARAQDDEPTAPAKAESAESSEFAPKFERSVLEQNGKTLKLRRSLPGAPRECVAGDYRLVLDKTSVKGFRGGGEKPLWEAKIPDNLVLLHLGDGNGQAYLQGFVSTDRDYRPETPARVRRLELATGQWLTDAVLQEKLEPGESESVDAVVAGAGALIVLSKIQTGSEKAHDLKLAGYRVSRFDEGGGKLRWSKRFPSAGEVAPQGAFLLSAGRHPESASSELKALTWLTDNDILMLAGARQNLLRLSANTGEVRWQVKRLWEYERGFVGPSVWSHFISRGGKDLFGQEEEDRKEEQKDNDNKKDKDNSKDKDNKKDNATDKENPKTADKSDPRYQAVVAGPFIVGGPAGTSIFVGVAKGPAQWGRYLSDCVVYELNADGKPVAMVNLPRMMSGSEAKVVDGGLVCACQNGGFVRLAPSERAVGFGPGGPNMLVTVEWFRQTPKPSFSAWLGSDPVGVPTVFGDADAIRIPDGGYIAASGDKVFSFPLARVDLKTGLEENLVLKVPFEGSVPVPKSNFSRRGGSTRTYGPYLMAVTGVAFSGETLRITIGTEGSAQTLEFDWPRPPAAPKR